MSRRPRGAGERLRRTRRRPPRPLPDASVRRRPGPRAAAALETRSAPRITDRRALAQMRRAIGPAPDPGRVMWRDGSQPRRLDDRRWAHRAGRHPHARVRRRGDRRDGPVRRRPASTFLGRWFATGVWNLALRLVVVAARAGAARGDARLGRRAAGPSATPHRQRPDRGSVSASPRVVMPCTSSTRKALRPPGRHRRRRHRRDGIAGAGRLHHRLFAGQDSSRLPRGRGGQRGGPVQPAGGQPPVCRSGGWVESNPPHRRPGEGRRRELVAGRPPHRRLVRTRRTGRASGWSRRTAPGCASSTSGDRPTARPAADRRADPVLGLRDTHRRSHRLCRRPVGIRGWPGSTPSRAQAASSPRLTGRRTGGGSPTCVADLELVGDEPPHRRHRWVWGHGPPGHEAESLPMRPRWSPDGTRIITKAWILLVVTSSTTAVGRSARPPRREHRDHGLRVVARRTDGRGWPVLRHRPVRRRVHRLPRPADRPDRRGGERVEDVDPGADMPMQLAGGSAASPAVTPKAQLRRGQGGAR